MSKIKLLCGAFVVITAGCQVAFAQNAGRYTVVRNLPVCESFAGWQQWVKDPGSPPRECYSIPAGTTITVIGVKAGSVAIELSEGAIGGHPTFAIAPERWDYLESVQ